MAAAAILNPRKFAFLCENYVKHQIFNIFTKLGDDCPNSKDMAANFRNSRWRWPPSWIWENLHFYVTDEFYVRFSTFPPNLVRIGPIVKKWQPIFRPPSWIWKNLHFYVTVELDNKFPTFPPNLVRIGPIIKKWQRIFEILDGGGRHLEFIKIRICN